MTVSVRFEQKRSSNAQKRSKTFMERLGKRSGNVRRSQKFMLNMINDPKRLPNHVRGQIHVSKLKETLYVSFYVLIFYVMSFLWLIFYGVFFYVMTHGLNALYGVGYNHFCNTIKLSILSFALKRYYS